MVRIRARVRVRVRIRVRIRVRATVVYKRLGFSVRVSRVYSLCQQTNELGESSPNFISAVVFLDSIILKMR